MPSGFIIIGIILLFIIWALIEQKQLVITKYTVTSAKLPKEFDGTSFVVLADLHNYVFGENNERLARRIEELSPEFIVIAGDMINKMDSCYPSHAFSLIEKLAKSYKIYYAYGNHEQRFDKFIAENKDQTMDQVSSTWVEYKKMLRKMNVTFLNNESSFYIKKNKCLAITGVSIDQQFFQRNKIPAMEDHYINSLLGSKPESDYQLLIAHNPVYFSNYTRWGADLTISGHLHGGLVRLPGVGGVISPQVKLFPKYNAGNFSEMGQEMIVSRGLGSHSNMPRLFNAPEIVYVTLKNIK